MLLATYCVLRTAHYSRTLTQLIGLLRNAPLDLVSVIDDFGALIYAELDYGVEAASAARFARQRRMVKEAKGRDRPQWS